MILQCDSAAKADFKAGYYLVQLSLDCGYESSATALICDVIKRQSLAWLH